MSDWSLVASVQASIGNGASEIDEGKRLRHFAIDCIVYFCQLYTVNSMLLEWKINPR